MKFRDALELVLKDAEINEDALATKLASAECEDNVQLYKWTRQELLDVRCAIQYCKDRLKALGYEVKADE